MFANSKPVMKVISESCLIAKVMAALIMVMGTLAAMLALLRSPFKSAKWVTGISAFFMSAGAALMIMVVYDNLCKAGYQKTVVVAFAVTFLSALIAFISNAM